MIKLPPHVYDVESYPNFFCVGFAPLTEADEWHYFEISDRADDGGKLFYFLTMLERMIGFNNFTYDWLMIDHFLNLLSKSSVVTAADMYKKSMEIISKGFQNRFQGVIWNPSIEQVDLFLLHHLDRFNVGLKQIEFDLREPNVMDSPIPFDQPLTYEQMDLAKLYNANDIRGTKNFAIKSLGDIQFRETFGPEFLSYSNGKIGKKIFERDLQAAGIQLYTPDQYGKRKPRQTPRPHGVRVADVILPFIKFTRVEFQLQLERIKSELVTKIEVKNGMKTKKRMLRPDGSEIKYQFNMDGFIIDVRLGGIHGSVEKRIVLADSMHKVHDVDVTSYYPSIAIVHRIFPEHLTESFCDVYGALKAQRVALDDDDPNKTTLKFALNVPFGESNSEHGIFFDPAYMLAITMNGQLMLCMLAEQFANVGAIELIQVNTDGVVIRYPVGYENIVHEIIQWWQNLTGMDLKNVYYNRLFIRDSNAYIAEDINGKRKRKNDYEYKKEWYQDHSQLIVAKAAEAAMLDDIDPEDFILNHRDAWDFLLFSKGNMQLTDGTPLERNIRYYISESGQGLVMLYPPLAGKTERRRIGKHATGLAQCLGDRKTGYHCSECGEPFGRKSDFEKHNKLEHCYKIQIVNYFDGQMPHDIDYRYYISETNKLIIDG